LIGAACQPSANCSSAASPNRLQVRTSVDAAGSIRNESAGLDRHPCQIQQFENEPSMLTSYGACSRSARRNIYDDIFDRLRVSIAILPPGSKIRLTARIPNPPHLVATSEVSIQLGCRSLQRRSYSISRWSRRPCRALWGCPHRDHNASILTWHNFTDTSRPGYSQVQSRHLKEI
jgi:hypothetical protein